MRRRMRASAGSAALWAAAWRTGRCPSRDNVRGRSSRGADIGIPSCLRIGQNAPEAPATTSPDPRRDGRGRHCIRCCRRFASVSSERLSTGTTASPSTSACIRRVPGVQSGARRWTTSALDESRPAPHPSIGTGSCHTRMSGFSREWSSRPPGLARGVPSRTTPRAVEPLAAGHRGSGSRPGGRSRPRAADETSSGRPRA